MFPLETDVFPTSSSQLAQLLNESLSRIFVLDGDPVTLREKAYPRLEEMRVCLDGARVRENLVPPKLAAGETSPALEIDRMSIKASALSIGPARMDLILTARDVRLGQVRNDARQVILTMENAAEGKIEISTTQSDLEALIAEKAKSEAAKHEVTIERVQLILLQKSPRSLVAEVRLRARKLFLSASVQITGQLDLDDQLNAKISRLECNGDGAIAAIACGVLNPHLQKIDGREFSLMSLPLGAIRLRDIRFIVAGKLSVTAEFGAAA